MELSRLVLEWICLVRVPSYVLMLLLCGKQRAKELGVVNLLALRGGEFLVWRGTLTYTTFV